ncbi:hypothetical protein DB43_AI00010 [Parachlamydia acanthamoebae]|nr:hypothetical protein DB43_AI00010 [Parachlamydia acanthamoebae]
MQDRETGYQASKNFIKGVYNRLTKDYSNAPPEILNGECYDNYSAGKLGEYTVDGIFLAADAALLYSGAGLAYNLGSLAVKKVAQRTAFKGMQMLAGETVLGAAKIEFKNVTANASKVMVETVTNQILKKETELIAKEAGYAVYRCVQANSTIYVGITNNFIRRSAEHLSKKNMLIHQLIGGLTKMEARGVEQALINYHGLSKNGGGSLINKINSISSSNPAYTIQLQKGYELLKSIGYI